jgi:serine/threonine protein kinase
LWSLGVIVWQMFSKERVTPFAGANQEETFSKIVACDFQMPVASDLSEAAEDLIKKLLVKDPSKRLGVSNFEELGNHPFFEGFDFDTCYDDEAPLPTR